MDIVKTIKPLEYLYIYIYGQRKIKFSSDLTFDKYASLGKARDLPLPPPKKKDDDMDRLEGPSLDETSKYIVDDLMEPMDSLDSPRSDPLARKRPLWLHDTLQNVERHVPAKATFRET